MMDTKGALTVLQRFVGRHTSQAAAAKALGISDAYLCDLLQGRRGLSDNILNRLGLAREVTIRATRKVDA